jgi:hypothetical protein
MNRGIRPSPSRRGDRRRTGRDELRSSCPGERRHARAKRAGTNTLCALENDRLILEFETMAVLDRIKHWFRRAGDETADLAEGGKPVATPPEDGSGQPERETSTNAQVQGASDEPRA